MSTKFHVNGRGEAGPCRAEKGFCPFGGDENHFASEAEVREAYEAAQGTPLQPVAKKEPEEIVAETNWNYDEAPKPEMTFGEKSPYLNVLFSRGQDDLLTLTGPEPGIRAYLRKLDEADAEKLSHLKSIHRKNPAVGSAKLSKWQQKFYGEWKERGSVRVAELPEHERNMVDLNLDYVNGATQRDRSKPNLEGYHRPYTNLYSYSPHMKGNAGTWVSTDLKFDHATGNFYGVTTVTGMPRSLMGKRSAVVKIEDYGQDFDAALTGCQNQSDASVSTYLESEPKASLSRLGKKADWFHDPLQEREPQDQAFTNHRELARKEFAKGIGEAREWNRLKRERENLTSQDEAAIAAAGY